MRGKKAKEIRMLVYRDKSFRFREYFMAENKSSVFCDMTRKFYQFTKKNHRKELPLIMRQFDKKFGTETSINLRTS